MMRVVLNLVVLLSLIGCCHGDGQSMQHLILLDQLPSQFSLYSSPQLIVRTNFSGFVDFKESEDFKVLLNVTAPAIEEAYAVTADITESKGRLLIQVYENKTASSPVTLPWIFIFITIATCLVIILASVYAIWWYCSKKHLDLQRDYYSHGNVMFRSRNSECLSSGPTDLLLQSEHGRDSMVDDGKDLPDVSEEDEDEDGRPIRRKKKTVVRLDESDEDNEKVDEKLTIKRRYQPPTKRLYREQQMRRHGRRKRHPSLNDPPSYDAVMEYPEGSSDESDEETNQKKTYINSSRSVEERSKRDKQFVESSRSFGEQTSYQRRDLYSYNPLAFQTIPVAHSDTELSVPLRSPRYVAHNIPPRGFVNPMERHGDEYTENKDKKFEKILNSKESVIQGERSKSPFGKENRNRSTPVPREERVQSPNNLERSASFRSNHSQSSRHERTKTPTSVGRTTPNHFDKSSTPSHYEQSSTPIYSDRSNTVSQYARAKSPMDRNKTHIYAKAKKPPPLKLPPGIANETTKQNNLDETSGYIQLKSTSGPPIEKLTPIDQVDSSNSNPMDIPLTTFTGSLKKKKRHKSKPETGESPKRNVLEGYNYNTLPTSPLSPRHPLNITGTSTINSQRFSVLSDNSISLYSSGEVYSPTGTGADKDEEDDDDDAFEIDFEIPPLKPMEADGLSEASLPLPSPPAYAKMPPGYSPRTLLPSPKPRPQPLSALSHSIPVDEDMLSGTYIGLTASPTNTMDRIFQFPSPHRDSGISSERSLPLSQGDDSPITSPSRPYHPAQRELPLLPTQGYAWNGGRKTPEKGEYARIKQANDATAKENGEVKVTPNASGGGGRKKPVLKPKALHLAVICSISILSLASTVYSALLPSQTQVHVTVYAPKNFLQKEIQVYFNQNRPGEILDDQLHNIQAYDMADPYLRVVNSSFCSTVQCEHGCDENNGNCICKKGYRLDAKGVCQDVNECRSVIHRCHENADCLDREGSYQCHCSGYYYGDGKTCYECAAPCGEGTYEFQPCSQNQKKICLDCTKECAKGFYMTRRCHAQGDSVCRMCHKKCEKEEFESSRCTDVTNRVCQNRNKLAPPIASGNVILENMRDVSKFNQEELFRPRGFHIDRGSGFFIKGNVIFFRPQIILHPVNHEKQNELNRFSGDQSIVDKYCPYPVPSYYELVKLTQLNITYKSKTYYGKTYIEPCKTYMDHGVFPDSKQASRTILCSKPGPVTSIFEITSNFGTSTPYWVEKHENCVSKNAACLNCTKTCAKKMRLQGGDCGVTDKDNGRSPRLPLCMTCCADANCTDLCQTYHDYICQTEQCLVGDLLGFQLRPVFVNPEDVYCHMYPAANQKIAEINYKVMNYYNTLVSRSFVVYSDGSWTTSGKLDTGDEIVDIEVDSKVRQIPDFIKVLTGRKEIEAGQYKSHTASVSTLYTETIGLCRPDLPFSTTSESFAKHSCDDEVLSNLIIATGLDEPFVKFPGKVDHIHDNYTYTVSSEDSTNLPNMKITVNRKKSLLESLFPMATLQFENLLGNISHNATHWVVNLTGRIEKCPGVLGINLTDPGYPDEPLYQYMIEVTCPEKFDLTFGLPTGDKPFLNKEVVLSVKDKKYMHQLFVFKPASKKIYYTQGSTTGQMAASKDPQKPSHFSIPFIASVVGVVMLLLFITSFGMMVVFGQPTSDVLRFNWCHLVLMVGYISFQFLFAICASMTVFVLVIVAVNSDTTAFLKNYQQQRSVKSAFTHLEMDHMERYLKTEIQRQNSAANLSKHECDQQMLIIIENLNELQKEIEKNITDDIEKKDIRGLLSKQITSLSQKFVNNVAAFKERFDSYTKFMGKKFSTDLKKTYRSIEKNKWLATAQFLRRSVKNVRDLEFLPTRPFTEWLGIQEDLTKLALDKPIPVVKYPDFNDVFIPPAKHVDSNRGDHNQSQESERTHQYHNLWVTPDMALPSQTQSQKSDYEEEDKRNYDGYFVFFALMVVIDVIWFLHRMSKAVGVCSLILYGYPIYVDIREKTDSTQDNEEDGSRKRNRWFKSGFCKSLKKFLLKALVSMFVPKVIATIFVCLFIYMLSMATFHFVNRETFSYLGYYNNMDDMLKLNEKFINRRLETHASRINLLQYPAYQELSNMYIQRHLQLFKSSETHLHTIHSSHASYYCNYLKSLDVAANCDLILTSDIPEVYVSACQFEKISARPYLRHTTPETNISDLQMDEFLFSIRKLIEDTCYIVLIFMSVVIIKELLGTVIWLYMKRSGFINLRIIFEADEPPNAPNK